ncbi:hypothetical protein P9990_19825 [Prescottella equi]|uniref:hypothetical protein n=1 Tax=Rhodococcus hoagii TaxID=43767 RepID=UPI00257791D1|nr:hypothetical protein [Prescottella equi]WJJ10804.1 hypothetical protein P9990_19825 [Prescottella equi]
MDLERVTSGSLMPPEQLKRFLGVNRWAIVEDHLNEWEIWRAPEDLHSPTVTLLFDEEYFDYDTRLFEANQLVQRAYQIDAVELAERITSLSADLFFVRIDQFSRDGTIPFKQAQRALESISTMVRAAATTTANPAHSHRGRRPAEVESFISDSLRLGHTKKGSFVVTAVARFDDEPPEFAAPREIKVDAGLGIEGDARGDAGDFSEGPYVNYIEGPSIGASAEEEAVLPFGRRVMRTLSRGLDAARRAAQDQTAIGIALEEGLSLELVEALEKISSEQGLRTIDVTFEWSPTIPHPSAVPERVVFEQEVIRALPTVAEALQIHDRPTRTEIVGPVVGLSRSVSNGAPGGSGPVTILADVHGSLRKVTVELDGEEHEWAIRAYQDHFPVIVSGELTKRRTWRMEGAVSLDVEAARQLTMRRPIPGPRQHFPEGPGIRGE